MSTAWAAALALLLPQLAYTQSSKPHILFIMADDLGMHDMQWRQSGIHTPNLNALWEAGTRLHNYYVQKSCTPTRTAFQTGRYPHRYGLLAPFWPGEAYGLPLNETTIANRMKDAGYVTHGVGKWHVGDCDERMTPTFKGYDTWYGFYGGGQDYFNHTAPALETNPTMGFDFHFDSQPNCARAVQIVKDHDASKPLFLLITHQAPHSPAQLPDYAWADNYTTVFPSGSGSASDVRQRQIFAGMVELMDNGVGQVIQAFKDKGIWSNTITVFSADNGGPIRPDDHHSSIGSSNYPLRGGKFAAYEGGVRGEGLIHGPGVPSNFDYRGLMHVVDWFATLSEAAGASREPFNPALRRDSISMWGRWERPRRRKSVVLDYDTNGRGAFRQGRWKLILGQTMNGMYSGVNGYFGEVTPDPYKNETEQLYRVDADGDYQERKNRANDKPLILQDLKRLYHEQIWGATVQQKLGPDQLPVQRAGTPANLAGLLTYVSWIP